MTFKRMIGMRRKITYSILRIYVRSTANILDDMKTLNTAKEAEDTKGVNKVIKQTKEFF